jgi:hypothetical protein
VNAKYETPSGAAAGRFGSKNKKSRTLWRLDGICYNQEGSVENETLMFSLARVGGFAYCPYNAQKGYVRWKWTKLAKQLNVWNRQLL